MIYITIENNAGCGALVVTDVRTAVNAAGVSEIHRRESPHMSAMVSNALRFAKDPTTLALVGRVIVEQHGSILYDSAYPR